ncbi:MAG: DUF1223 domain-containing protein [Chryseobacterium sp.]|jgi:hypothetical protein|uniref:DUF1223 domain-containing protein n=1 Tax=Chryseobacterium sp. TaxID=1871047 RepID=UPI00281DB36F|nr:DUF1223 domain-containing protein [Chryseobacterium sp.]MDR2236119.1 DUF1223 domain-containing protein [Chryseobacterium sp.]
MISKNLISTVVFTALMFAASAFVQKDRNPQKEMKAAAENKGFAVLELFTSEGCSSCPPADELMGKIEREYRGQPVYILSYHVDYWNRMGWKDRFSSAENTQRQQQYNRLLKSQTYTPQLIINGKTELVGSDANTIIPEIRKSLSGSGSTTIALSASVSQKDLTVQYKTEETDPSSVLQIALIEKKSFTQVSKGENEGRYLQHWQIVRQQRQISLKNHPEGTLHFTVPDHYTSDQWEVIGFVQHPGTGKITGASKAIIQ